MVFRVGGEGYVYGGLVVQGRLIVHSPGTSPSTKGMSHDRLSDGGNRRWGYPTLSYVQSYNRGCYMGRCSFNYAYLNGTLSGFTHPKSSPRGRGECALVVGFGVWVTRVSTPTGG